VRRPRAVLTDYSGGVRGTSLNPVDVQLEAGLFLADLNFVFPGAHAAARRVQGNVVAHLEHWPTNPLSLGSYTCYKPGQFTTIAGLEGLPVGNVFFAGEHANSFYVYQGFMEGAALSGVDVAAAILKAARR
jgi:monoamine oxidase